MTTKISTEKAPKDLLVAILKHKSSLTILKDEGWYHIPAAKIPSHWPPKTLAFYQGWTFGGDEACKIRYFGEVSQIDKLSRKELFPNDKRNQYKAEDLYYRLQLKTLEERAEPIVSYRPRVVVFIPTSWSKFALAEQINDLYDDSPLEDLLWQKLKRLNFTAERQWKLNIQNKIYFLDFAIFCKNNNKLAIEVDGYHFHYESKEQIDYDTWRQNEIQIDEWSILRYTSQQVMNDWTPYLAQIQEKVKQLGGLESPEDFNRKIGDEAGVYTVDW